MKRKVLILSVLAILLAILAANTLAYFTADTTAHNVITTGNVDIALNEWANEERTERFEKQIDVLPGTEVTKIVEVENIGAGSVWVRIWTNGVFLSEDGTPLDPGVYTLDINTADWTKQGDFYYYNRALAPGETTEPLFTTVSFNAAMDNRYQDSDLYLDVNAFAVQSANNGTGALDAAGWPSFTPPTNP